MLTHFLAITITGFGLLAPANQRPLPAYEVARVTAPIKIDGQLNERAWREVQGVGDFVNNRDGSSSNLKTEARVLYDDKYLYFAFRSIDRNIWATMKRRDEHLWLEEVVEVFLQANQTIPNYIELEVNPLGTMLDIYLLDTRKPLHYESWNSEKAALGGECSRELLTEKMVIVNGLAKWRYHSKTLRLLFTYLRSRAIIGG
jgi:hypothetical protein